MDNKEPLPSHAFVPGGKWPRPREGCPPAQPLHDANGSGFAVLDRGIELFNAGFYWEAHEVWESLWHAEGRTGPHADVVKALIKLGAAGVKVREGQSRGVSTHARRAADLFDTVRAAIGPVWFGLDLEPLSVFARETAQNPPEDPLPRGTQISIVFAFRLERRS